MIFNFGSLIRRNRRAIDADLAGSWRRRYFSPVAYGLYTSLIPKLRQHASGRLLDAGCGTTPFRSQLERQGVMYHGVDIEVRTSGIAFRADVQDLSTIRSESYDTVLCSEVLEHLPRPESALREFHRVLRMDGKLILTVPFLSRLHEEPQDYFRYTVHGLRELLTRHGFSVLEIQPTAAVFSFLGHQVSTVALCSTFGVPIIRQLVFWANLAVCVLPCYWVDRLMGFGRLMPAGYLAVAVKRAQPR